MKTLGDLLSHYKNLKTPHATLCKVFITSVEKLLDITLEEKDVRIHKSIISIQAPSVIKNEIRLHQKELLSEVHAQLGEHQSITAIF